MTDQNLLLQEGGYPNAPADIKAIETWPKRIYLQQDEEDLQPFKGSHYEEITWADSNINGCDVGYVRADIIEQLERDLAEARKDAGQVYGIIDPDYGRTYTIIRKLAWEEGYAIGLHGSFTRDLDLIAVPWADRVCEPEHLIRRICASTAQLQSLPSNPGTKPHGRLVWTLMLPEFGDPRFVDLSIMPVAMKDKP